MGMASLGMTRFRCQDQSCASFQITNLVKPWKRLKKESLDVSHFAGTAACPCSALASRDEGSFFNISSHASKIILAISGSDHLTVQKYNTEKSYLHRPCKVKTGRWITNVQLLQIAYTAGGTSSWTNSLGNLPPSGPRLPLPATAEPTKQYTNTNMWASPKTCTKSGSSQNVMVLMSFFASFSFRSFYKASRYVPKNAIDYWPKARCAQTLLHSSSCSCMQLHLDG